jgi:hypothetical protein
MVLAYYSLVEKVDYFQDGLRQNEIPLISFVVTWHIICNLLRVLDEKRQFKHHAYRELMIGIGVVVGALSVLTIILTPIFSWFDWFKVGQMDTSYWTLRYLTMFLYILLNASISIFPHVRNFVFFLSDQLLLS